jgi:Asp-tRNA(Asn)/Glu-tRNA(Gln) amidotransferase A subunit family amidase
MAELNRLSLTEASALIASRQIKPSELFEACAQRIEAREADVKAFQHLDLDKARSAVLSLDNNPAPGPLYGIPVGIKDIIDTADMPTTMGSPIYSDNSPRFDAACVSALRAADVIIPGKTVTTEFACFHPGKTRNPHQLNHTPGGSSMGSAAAVADHMLPVAVGSQTAASVIRPAAYCGVVGYKASQGEFNLAGICSLSQSMDSLGFFVRDIADLSLIRHCLLATPKPAVPAAGNILIGLVRTPHWQEASAETQSVIESSVAQLEANGAIVEEIDFGPMDGALTEAQKTVMVYEACRSRCWEYNEHIELLSKPMVALIESGIATRFEDYQAAQKLAAEWRRQLSDLLETVDALIAPAAMAEAPAGLGNTGDPLFSRMWNLLGGPSITIPAGTGPQGLPLGLQIIGQNRRDDRLIQVAEWIQQRLNPVIPDDRR